MALSKEGEKDDGDGDGGEDCTRGIKAAKHGGVWSLGSIQWEEIMDS